MIDFKALAAPFPPEEVSWRLGSVSKDKLRGMALAYLDARNVMDRLDDVCGPSLWQATYPHANAKTVCSIGILCGEHWVWKTNGAGDSDIEAEKGAMSDAFKRAAVLWGIGRYLYTLESPWVEVEEIGKTGKFRFAKSAYKELSMVLQRFNQSLLRPTEPSKEKPTLPPSNGVPKSFVEAARQDGTLDENRKKGEMPGQKPKLTPAEKTKRWIDNAISTLNLTAHTVDSISRFQSDNNEQIAWIQEYFPEEHDRFAIALDNASQAARAKVAA